MAAHQLLHHLLTADEWTRARKLGAIVPGSPATEPFVHCSTAAQVRETVRRRYPSASGLLVADIAVSRLTHEVRWEGSGGHGVFPHVYGPIPLVAITRVLPWPIWNADRRMP